MPRNRPTTPPSLRTYTLLICRTLSPAEPPAFIHSHLSLLPPPSPNLCRLAKPIHPGRIPLTDIRPPGLETHIPLPTRQTPPHHPRNTRNITTPLVHSTNHIRTPPPVGSLLPRVFRIPPRCRIHSPINHRDPTQHSGYQRHPARCWIPTRIHPRPPSAVKDRPFRNRGPRLLRTYQLQHLPHRGNLVFRRNPPTQPPRPPTSVLGRVNSLTHIPSYPGEESPLSCWY